MKVDLLPVLWRPSDPLPVALLLGEMPLNIKADYFTECYLRHCDDAEVFLVLYGKFSYLCVGPSLALFISFNIYDTGKPGYWLALCRFMEDERRALYVS